MADLLIILPFVVDCFKPLLELTMFICDYICSC